MERTQRILDCFPSFFKTWDKDSLIYNVVCALGKRLDEAEKDMFAIMRAHWVDKAFRIDLDYLGALYNIKRKPGETDSEYRNRLKRAIMEFKGGGTISAVLTSVRMALGLPRDYPLELVENPPVEIYKEFSVRTGETWWQSSESVLDATPSIEINVETEAAKITNPTIINMATGDSVTYEGIIQSGEQLNIEDGKAFLSGVDVKGRMSTAYVPKLLRGGSTWRYAELLEKEIGVFDVARFDESMFPIGIATVKISFKWVGYQPATFEIKVPKDVISRRGGLSLAQEVVDSIKATGVRAIIKVIEG